MYLPIWHLSTVCSQILKPEIFKTNLNSFALHLPSCYTFHLSWRLTSPWPQAPYLGILCLYSASFVGPQFLRRQCGLMVIHSSTVCDIHSAAQHCRLICVSTWVLALTGLWFCKKDKTEVPPQLAWSKWKECGIKGQCSSNGSKKRKNTGMNNLFLGLWLKKDFSSLGK